MSDLITDANRYFVRSEVGAVLIPAEVCARMSDTVLARLRSELRGTDPIVDAALFAIQLAGLAHRSKVEKPGSRSGTSLASYRELGAPSSQCGATEAANQLSMTKRAVTKAAGAGRLRGRQVGGRWQFEPEAIAAFRSARA